jgi:hypothetical protein
MKYSNKKVIVLIISMIIIFFAVNLSCNKEYSCEGCKENNKPPIAIAGPDQVITLPADSISLDGSASNDPDGTISVWLWKKISGPASFNIVNTTTAKTIVRNLDTGIYKFELKVTDDKGLIAKDTMQVNVNSGTPTNRPPVANAGADQTITLPTNTITLNGSGSTDPENNITSYVWTKISGPSAFNMTNFGAVQAQVTNLIEGVYLFELVVTDAGGLFDKDSVLVTVKNDPAVDIYVAGGESNGNNIGVAKYWKNGQAIPLTDGTKNATATSIAVVGSDVYVAGCENNGNDIYVAKYWKNGQAMKLTDGTKHAYASSIAVVGSDVYVAGWEKDGTSYYSYFMNDSGQGIDSSLVYHDVAKYWKNGVAISLTDGTEHAYANSIVLVGGDVYVAGSESDGELLLFDPLNERHAYIAKYWKNGQAINLSDGTKYAHANSIVVVGSDVYVAGQEMNEANFYQAEYLAKYWKNGVAVSLTNGTSLGANAISIAVSGNDVYVAGHEWTDQSLAKYWKNGVAVTLDNSYSNARSVTVFGSDVYVAGTGNITSNSVTSIAKYWKNGQAVNLTGSSSRAGANSIVVVQH